MFESIDCDEELQSCVACPPAASAISCCGPAYLLPQIPHGRHYVGQTFHAERLKHFGSQAHGLQPLAVLAKPSAQLSSVADLFSDIPDVLPGLPASSKRLAIFCSSAVLLFGRMSNIVGLRCRQHLQPSVAPQSAYPALLRDRQLGMKVIVSTLSEHRGGGVVTPPSAASDDSQQAAHASTAEERWTHCQFCL